MPTPPASDSRNLVIQRIGATRKYPSLPCYLTTLATQEASWQEPDVVGTEGGHRTTCLSVTTGRERFPTYRLRFASNPRRACDSVSHSFVSPNRRKRRTTHSARCRAHGPKDTTAGRSPRSPEPSRLAFCLPLVLRNVCGQTSRDRKSVV